MKKVASICGRSGMCSDDGRAITYDWQLFLNDHGGQGFWHGGPGYPNHGRAFDTEADARAYAGKLGYEVREVRWG